MTPKRKSKRTNKKKSFKKNFNDKGKYSSSTSLKDKQKKILNKLENVVNKIRSIKKKVKKYSNKKNKKKSVKKITNFIKKSNVKFDLSMLVPNYNRKYDKKQVNFSTQPFIEQQYQELQTNFNSQEIATSPFNFYDLINEQQRFVDDFVTPIGVNFYEDDDRPQGRRRRRVNTPQEQQQPINTPQEQQPINPRIRRRSDLIPSPYESAIQQPQQQPQQEPQRRRIVRSTRSRSVIENIPAPNTVDRQIFNFSLNIDETPQQQQNINPSSPKNPSSPSTPPPPTPPPMSS